MNISILDFINDNNLLEITYVPFDVKVEIVKTIISTVAENAGYLDSSVLRRVAFETMVNTITNIDMNIECEYGLKGYDYLCYSDSEATLLSHIGPQYDQFWRILEEQVRDYKDGTFRDNEVSEG